MLVRFACALRRDVNVTLAFSHSLSAAGVARVKMTGVYSCIISSANMLSRLGGPEVRTVGTPVRSSIVGRRIAPRRRHGAAAREFRTQIAVSRTLPLYASLPFLKGIDITSMEGTCISSDFVKASMHLQDCKLASLPREASLDIIQSVLIWGQSSSTL